MRAEVVKALAGQDLLFFAEEGRPSATPTVAILDEGGSTISSAATTNVTLDSVTTTVAATTSAGASSFTVASATGIVVGRTYELKSAGGQLQWVRVRSVSGTTVTPDSPLEFAHTTASTLKGTYFSYALQTTDVSTLRERMQAVATYVVDGETYVRRILFDVCLYVLTNPLTRERLTQSSPDIGIAEWAEQRGSAFERQRTAAWEAVCVALRQKGKRPALVVDVEDLVPWALAELGLILQRGGVKVIRDIDPIAALEDLKQQREQARDAALSGLSWYDATEDASADEDEEIGRPRALDFVR